ncbi:hypothetical protein M885DRAFT_519327 [Pelagophyceae sp. CCMP2097]|nr:hypothetical protein M885DRAFT_519327 [Pelagophyceae sp. CCMP2097]
MSTTLLMALDAMTMGAEASSPRRRDPAVSDRRKTQQRKAALVLLKELDGCEGRDAYLAHLRSVTHRLVDKESRKPRDDSTAFAPAETMGASTRDAFAASLPTFEPMEFASTSSLKTEPLPRDTAARLKHVRAMRLGSHGGTPSVAFRDPTDGGRAADDGARPARRSAARASADAPSRTRQRSPSPSESASDEESTAESAAESLDALEPPSALGRANAQRPRASPPQHSPKRQPTAALEDTRARDGGRDDEKTRTLRAIFQRAAKGDVAFAPAIAVALEHDLAAADEWGVRVVKAAARALSISTSSYIKWSDLRRLVEHHAQGQ